MFLSKVLGNGTGSRNKILDIIPIGQKIIQPLHPPGPLVQIAPNQEGSQNFKKKKNPTKQKTVQILHWKISAPKMDSVDNVANTTASGEVVLETAPPVEDQSSLPTVARNTNWLHCFAINPKGLQRFQSILARNPQACLATEFHNCFAAVFCEEKEGQNTFLHEDMISFHETFKEWERVAEHNTPTSLEYQQALDKVENKLVRCFKDLYYVGPVDLPALQFCGTVDVAAMMRKGDFHGYNERSLSLPQAKELQADMAKDYKSISGLETIFLMAKQPIASVAAQLDPSWNGDVVTDADKLALLQSFASRSFADYTEVPQLFIPCCGELINPCIHMFEDKSIVYTYSIIYVLACFYSQASIEVMHWDSCTRNWEPNLNFKCRATLQLVCTIACQSWCPTSFPR